MERRHVVTTVLAVVLNACALAYGLGGLFGARNEALRVPVAEAAVVGPTAIAAPGGAH